MRRSPIVVVFVLALSLASPAQDTHTCDFRRPQYCALAVARDQAGIWSSPARAKPHDLLWIVPLAAATGVAIHYDARAMQELGANPGTISTARSISNWGAIYVPLGTIGVGYVIGVEKHDDHLRRAAMLAGEAVADGLLLDEGLKYLTNRERPDIGEKRGEFWAHGFTGYTHGRSFPSGHSAMAWSFARVMAEEYPHWWSDAAFYGIATSVSVTRVLARQHFPSDVIVGSALGYLVGGYVYRHHEPNANHGITVNPLMGSGTVGFSVAIH